MKHKLFTFAFVIVLAITSFSQQSYVKYTYDAAGNRTIRETITIPPARYSNPNNIDSIGAAKDSSSLQASNVNDQQLQPVKETLSTGQTVTIFPNPTSGALAVEITNAGTSGTSTTSTGSVTSVTSMTASLQIVDVSGKQHYIKNKIAGREEINLSNVPAGVYFLRVEINGKMEEWKIIKQ